MMLSLGNESQVGFVPECSSHNHLRLLLHLLWDSSAASAEVLATQLHAEKAFDRVHWPFFGRPSTTSDLTRKSKNPYGVVTLLLWLE